MKQCPNCQRNYPNDAAPFCAEDGTRLIEVSAVAADNPAATMMPTQMSFQPSPPQQQSFSPMPGHSFQVPQSANANSNTQTKNGLIPIVLGIAAILFSFGGFVIDIAFFGFGSYLIFAGGVIGLILATIAVVLAYRARKGRIVATAAILVSLIPLCFSAVVAIGLYVTKNNLLDYKKETSSTSSDNIPSSSIPTASNTPRDALIAFTDACQREHYAAVREQMSNSLLEGLEKIAKQRNIASYKLIQDSFIKPIKAEMDSGGQVQTRNEIITGNTATVENTITGRRWDKTKFIIEDGRWKITNN